MNKEQAKQLIRDTFEASFDKRSIIVPSQFAQEGLVPASRLSLSF